MVTKQTILIIGTGKVGSWIASKLSQTHYHVLLCDKDYGKCQDLTNELQQKYPLYDVEAMECSYNSAWEADIVIMATPCDEARQVASHIKDVVNQKVVITLVDTTSGHTPEAGIADELQRLLPHTKVVKVFAGDVVAPHQNLQVYVSSNNDEAVETVAEVLASAGLNPVINSSYELELVDLHQEK